MEGDEPYDFILTIRPQLHKTGDEMVADIIRKGKSTRSRTPRSVQSIITSIKREVVVYS